MLKVGHQVGEINWLVYKLYNLTREEVKVVDSGFELSEEEYENFKFWGDGMCHAFSYFNY